MPCRLPYLRNHGITVSEQCTHSPMTSPTTSPLRWRAPTAAVISMVALMSFLLTACRLSSPTSPVSTTDGTVLEVIDGDTIRLQIGNTKESVRLIGVNTPETKHPTKGVECFGPEASAFLHDLLPVGTRVRIERDAEARDTYRRLLLYVFLPTSTGERFVNLELVARGFAVPLSIEPNVLHQERFVAAAFAAQQNSLGLWESCK